jgi:hypothetical protein
MRISKQIPKGKQTSIINFYKSFSMLILKISDVDKKKKLFVHDNAVVLKKKTYLENVFLKITISTRSGLCTIDILLN